MPEVCGDIFVNSLIFLNKYDQRTGVDRAEDWGRATPALCLSIMKCILLLYNKNRALLSAQC